MSHNLDQYGSPIPADLVLLPQFESLTEDGVAVVTAATWYEADRILMASASQIGYLSEDDPQDVGVNVAKAEVFRVAEALKRWSEQDGWYHA